MSKAGSNLGKSLVTRLVGSIYANLKERKSKNKTIKRNPKLNYNRGVAR